MSRPILLGIVMLVLLVIPYSQTIVSSAGTGYLAIKDYLGTTWTMSDVGKMVNYTFTTSDGQTKSLADYFWIVVDNNTSEKYSMNNFTASPLDGKTAVLQLPAGDHYVDVYWFGYHQHQLVHIVAGETYTLNLNTAPVIPWIPLNKDPENKPPSSAEWDLIAGPDGLVVKRKDGMASVRFVYNQSYIEVKWYDKDLGGWQYQDLDIYIDTNYQYRFHINSTNYPKYYEEKTGSFLWLSWDVYKIDEEVKWNRTGEILHVTYIVGIAENEALLRGVDEFFSGVAKTVVANALRITGLIDPVTYTVTSIKAFVDYVHSAYDTYMGEFYASKYQRTVIIVWDVFVTPTQIVVLAHAYDVDSNDNVVKKPITSANAFTIGNRLVYIKQLGGGIGFAANKPGVISKGVSISSSGSGVSEQVWSITNAESFNYDTSTTPATIKLPGGGYMIFHLDDLSKYHFTQWLALNIYYHYTDTNAQDMHYEHSISIKLSITFYDAGKADQFQQQLDAQGISYTRSGNTFTFTKTVYSHKTYQSPQTIKIALFREYDDVEKYIPPNSSGTVEFKVSGYIKVGSGITPNTVYADIKNLHYLFSVTPKMTPPQVSLLKDGYQIVNGAFAVQVYTDLYKEDKDAYMLGYYLLGNEPPPSYIIRDVHYDIDHDVIYYVYTIISADCYGQDLVDESATYNSTTGVHNYYLSYKKTVRVFNNVTLALFSYNRMAFLNLAPEVIEYLLALPPSEGGYGTPIIDWATVSTITVDMGRPYELYYYDKGIGQWIQVTVSYDNSTEIYTILRSSDDTAVESLSPGDMSQYYYKLIYTDTNETLKGWLHNKNGTLELITGTITWSLTPQELDQIMHQLQLQGIYDKWLEQWNEIARKLGLVNDALNNLLGAWNWLNRNWKWILLGAAAFLLLLSLIMASGSRRTIVIRR